MKFATLLLLCAFPALAQRIDLTTTCDVGTASCTTKAVVAPTGVPVTCQAGKDNGPAITSAITQAKAKGLPVVLPAAVCNYGDVLTLDGVKMIGRGDSSVLYATNPSREVIWLKGSGSELRSVKLTGVTPTARAAPWEGSRVVAFGATQWVVDNVTIETSTGTGIQTAQAASNGVISNNRINGTMADGIHITDKASWILIQGNKVEATGDDGIAVVSYKRDGGPVHHIIAVGNTVANNRSGRSMSVVGGENVLYEQNRLSNSGLVACLYLAQESSYDTLAVKNVIARYNTLENCGSVPATGHAAVMVFSSAGAVNDSITIQRNDIKQSGTQIGIRAFGPQTNIVIDSNRITGIATEMALPSGLTVTPYTSGPVGAR